MSNSLRSLAPPPTSGSFLPEDYIAAKADTRANLITLSLFLIVLGAVVAAFFVTHHRWQALKARQTEVNEMYVAETQKIEQLKALEAQRASMLEKAEITAALIERVPRWAMLGEIALRMSDRMRLDEVKLKSTRVEVKAASAAPAPAIKSLTKKVTGDKAAAPAELPKVTAPRFEYALTVGGTAEENNDIADFLASLKSSPIFDRVELGFIRESRESDRLLRKFEITCALRDNVDSRDVATSLTTLVADKAQRDQAKTNTPGTIAGVREGQ